MVAAVQTQVEEVGLGISAPLLRFPNLIASNCMVPGIFWNVVQTYCGKKTEPVEAGICFIDGYIYGDGIRRVSNAFVTLQILIGLVKFENLIDKCF